MRIAAAIVCQFLGCHHLCALSKLKRGTCWHSESRCIAFFSSPDIVAWCHTESVSWKSLSSFHTSGKSPFFTIFKKFCWQMSATKFSSGPSSTGLTVASVGSYSLVPWDSSTLVCCTLPEILWFAATLRSFAPSLGFWQRPLQLTGVFPSSLARHKVIK